MLRIHIRSIPCGFNPVGFNPVWVQFHGFNPVGFNPVWVQSRGYRYFDVFKSQSCSIFFYRQPTFCLHELCMEVPIPVSPITDNIPNYKSLFEHLVSVSLKKFDIYIFFLMSFHLSLFLYHRNPSAPILLFLKTYWPLLGAFILRGTSNLFLT